MHNLGIQSGSDLRAWSLEDLQVQFGKSGPWYYKIAHGVDHRPVNPNRTRKSSGSETTVDEDLIDPLRIETGVVGMADDVWNWCELTGRRGRTVTVKIKWADFQQSTRSQSRPRFLESKAELHEASPALVRSLFPPPKGVRLVGVTLSNLHEEAASLPAEDLLAIIPVTDAAAG